MNKTIVVIVIIASIILIVKVATISSSKNDQSLSKTTTDINTLKEMKPKFSTWLWKDISTYTPKELDTLLKESANRHIAVIYLNIERYIHIRESANTEDQKLILQEEYEKTLATFIDKANENNIEVVAMAGDTSWAFDSHIYIPKMLVTFVNTFNDKYNTNKFSGLHFDVEFYNSDSYKEASTKEKIALSKQYLDFVQLIDELSQTPIGFAIPYWFNRDDTQITFEYGSTNASIFEHLLTLIGKQSGENKDTYNHLSIMSYRRKTEGNNSTIEIVNDLFRIVDKSDKKVLLYIGQDVATSDTSMSFMRNEKTDFLKAANKINSEFVTYDFYGGIAVHHLTDYLLME